MKIFEKTSTSFTTEECPNSVDGRHVFEMQWTRKEAMPYSCLCERVESSLLWTMLVSSYKSASYHREVRSLFFFSVNTVRKHRWPVIFHSPQDLEIFSSFIPGDLSSDWALLTPPKVFLACLILSVSFLLSNSIGIAGCFLSPGRSTFLGQLVLFQPVRSRTLCSLTCLSCWALILP